MFERAFVVSSCLSLSCFSPSSTFFSFTVYLYSVRHTIFNVVTAEGFKTTALTQNEEYCTVAIYNPLTKSTPFTRSRSSSLSYEVDLGESLEIILHIRTNMFRDISSSTCRSSLHPAQHLLYLDSSLARMQVLSAPRSVLPNLNKSPPDRLRSHLDRCSQCPTTTISSCFAQAKVEKDVRVLGHFGSRFCQMCVDLVLRVACRLRS